MPPKDRKKAAVPAAKDNEIDAEFSTVDEILNEKKATSKLGQSKKKKERNGTRVSNLPEGVSNMDSKVVAEKSQVLDHALLDEHPTIKSEEALSPTGKEVPAGRGRKKVEKVEEGEKTERSATGEKGEVAGSHKRSAPDGKESKPGKIARGGNMESSPTQRRSDLSTLDTGSDSKTSGGNYPWNYKIVSWNVNGVRAWVQKSGLAYVRREDPDVLCLQETKCADAASLPPELRHVPGYHCSWLPGDTAAHSGVAMLSKEEPLRIVHGIGIKEHDAEGRVITAEFERFFLVTTYVPNSGRGLVRLDYRKKWDEDFRAYLIELDRRKPVILCGDLNVAHQEIDIANPKSNKKNAGFTQEERSGFSALLSAGFVDTFRHLRPEECSAYTFWTYMRNARAKDVGWRLDYFVVSERCKRWVSDSVIRKDVYGSDHCPICLFLYI